MVHTIKIRCAAGPGGTNCWAVCTCDWWGRPKAFRSQAEQDGALHLRDCLQIAFESEAI